MGDHIPAVFSLYCFEKGYRTKEKLYKNGLRYVGFTVYVGLPLF